MSKYDYPPPVDKLLTYGECQGAHLKWINYLELGYTSAHIPDLIRMATDDKLNWAELDSLEVWAPIHAWRALAQLRATQAIEPFLGLFDELNGSEWLLGDMPEVYALIGPPVIPALRAYLADDSHLPISRICVTDCLERIGQAHPEARGECVAVLTDQLEHFAQNDPGLNGFLIYNLSKLRATKALPLMQHAFEAQCVDTTIVGDWEDVQIKFGLKTTRDKPRQIPPEIEQTRQMLEAFIARSRSSEKSASPQPRKSKAKKRDKKQPGQRLRGKKRKS